jgi:phosphate transport system protein
MMEIRTSFHHELDAIRQDIVQLAAGVVERIPRGTEALLAGDLEAAEYVIRSDDEFNERALAIEERCYELLALQQPMAVDLRRLMAAVRMVSEIERSADLVVNICKGARRLYGHELSPRIRGLIALLSRSAQQEWKFVIDAYDESDVPLAAAIGDMDEVLDHHHNELIEAIFESHKIDDLDVSAAVQLALIARFYERIGDHAVNIAERVKYMVTGSLEDNETRLRSGDGRQAPDPGGV